METIWLEFQHWRSIIGSVETLQRPAGLNSTGFFVLFNLFSLTIMGKQIKQERQNIKGPIRYMVFDPCTMPNRPPSGFLVCLLCLKPCDLNTVFDCLTALPFAPIMPLSFFNYREALFISSITNAPNHTGDWPHWLAKLYVRPQLALSNQQVPLTSAYIHTYKKQNKSYYVDIYCQVFQ